MAEAFLKEQLSRWNEELARLHPDATRSEISDAEHHLSVNSFDSQCKLLKQWKLMYHSTQTQLLQSEGCKFLDHAEEALPEIGQELSKRRSKAKEMVKEQKNTILHENVALASCQTDVSNKFAELARLHDQCAQGLQEVQQLFNDTGSECSHGATADRRFELEADVLRLAEDAEDAEELAKLLRLQDEEVVKRRRLQDEEQRLQHILQEVQAGLETNMQLEKKFQLEANLEESLAKRAAALRLGLPRITFREGLVVLSHPDSNGASEEDNAIGTVKVEYENERLVRAEPHPSLQLWSQATAAVEQNDLACLLTQVWNRICQQSAGVSHQESPENGGSDRAGVFV